MKLGGSWIPLGVAVLIILAVGCNGTDIDLGLSNDAPPKSGPQPFAMVSFTPTQECVGKLMTLNTGGKDQPMLPGIDASRSGAAFLYLSDEGLVEPLIYLPVEDYELFLDELGHRIPVRRAIASSFKLGRYKLVVMQVGEYAGIGMSWQGIQNGPQSPEAWLQELPTDFDVVFKLNPEMADEDKQLELVSSLRELFGEKFAHLVSNSESVVCALNFDSTRNIDFQLQTTPVPENAEEIQAQMKNEFAVQGWTSSTEIEADHLGFDVAIPSEQAVSTWSQVQPAMANYVKSQLVVARQSSPTRRHSPGMAVGGPTTINDLCPDMGGGGGGGGTVRRT